MAGKLFTSAHIHKHSCYQNDSHLLGTQNLSLRFSFQVLLVSTACYDWFLADVFFQNNAGLCGSRRNFCYVRGLEASCISKLCSVSLRSFTYKHTNHFCLMPNTFFTYVCEQNISLTLALVCETIPNGHSCEVWRTIHIENQEIRWKSKGFTLNIQGNPLKTEQISIEI